MYLSLIAHLPVLPTPTSGEINCQELMVSNPALFHDAHADIGIPQSNIKVTLYNILSEILKINPG